MEPDTLFAIGAVGMIVGYAVILISCLWLSRRP
jgi:hypothetical protein